MRYSASDAATTGPGPLEVSFTFQPANKRGNGNRPDRTVEPESRAAHLEADGPGHQLQSAYTARRCCSCRARSRAWIRSVRRASFPLLPSRIAAASARCRRRWSLRS